MTRYHSNATTAARIAPGQLPGAIGVVVDRAEPLPIGIAFEVGRIGGVDSPPEAVWRLKIGVEVLDGRWVLRAGAFVELAEDAT